ncbi:hypothetical protein [Methyloceanibacter caenitepidi]|nr:hypothetical protein [Methyloceanibacter caenitepidi]
MMVVALVVLLAILAVIALVVWWMLDIDLPDVVASSITPAIGIGLIYAYGTPLAWAGGLLLLAIGVFALLYLMKRRERKAARHNPDRDEP